jgi:pyruvate dehydrogenase E1 component alpha subunit
METLVKSPAYADAENNRQLTKDDKMRLLREMFRVRRFEQTSLKYYNLGKMGGFLHLYTGQEAVASGDCIRSQIQGTPRMLPVLSW